jgi:Bax protein
MARDPEAIGGGIHGGRCRLASVLCAALLVLSCGNPARTDDGVEPTSEPQAEPVAAGVETFEFESYRDVEGLFQRLDYTPEVWRAGIREVPRLFLTRVGERWRDRTTKEITVQTKKRLFFRALVPLVLRSNELIIEDRERAEAIISAERAGHVLPEEDRQWLQQLAIRYDVARSADEPLAPADLDQLLQRVDVIPVSLALSQAAEESGWGTSRFAAEGNALFGQWTWGDNAIKPEKQREKLGNYGIASFESPLQSVLAYMHNLNTHRAYVELRRQRADLRATAQPLSGHVLAETLIRYSERGADYVKSLHTIMNVNRLALTDEAYLTDGPTIYLVPVGE